MGPSAEPSTAGSDCAVRGGEDGASCARAWWRRGRRDGRLSCARRGLRHSGGWARRWRRSCRGTTTRCGKLVGFDNPETAYELVVRWRKAHAEALVVVDQFEELFTLNPAETQERFATLLGRLTREPGGRTRPAVDAGRLPDPVLGARDPRQLVFLELTPLPALSGGSSSGRWWSRRRDRGFPVRGRGSGRGDGGLGGGGTGGAAASGLRRLAAVGASGPGEEASDAGGVRGNRGGGGGAGAARGSDDGPDREGASGHRAGGVPEPGDGAGDEGGGGAGGAAVGVPGAARRPRRCWRI